MRLRFGRMYASIFILCNNAAMCIEAETLYTSYLPYEILISCYTIETKTTTTHTERALQKNRQQLLQKYEEKQIENTHSNKKSKQT